MTVWMWLSVFVVICGFVASLQVVPKHIRCCALSCVSFTLGAVFGQVWEALGVLEMLCLTIAIWTLTIIVV
jgi:hypothetical protein